MPADRGLGLSGPEGGKLGGWEAGVEYLRSGGERTPVIVSAVSEIRLRWQNKHGFSTFKYRSANAPSAAFEAEIRRTASASDGAEDKFHSRAVKDSIEV